MNEPAKKLAQKKVDEMEPDENTNIWDGIKSGISVITSNSVCKTIPTSLLLLTDGESNVKPEGGIFGALQKFLGGVTPYYTLNTFGFGYKLDSKLLFDISTLGRGINCYLPVCNLVGTTFVNCVCNFLSTAAYNVSIEITSKDPVE